jgi:crossover junction endodeoxyribonuclease RuvC
VSESSRTKKIILMGIDPGTLITGYGVIELIDGKSQLITSDAIVNNNLKPMANRLETIYNKLNEVIRKFSPDEIAIETAFYGKNAQSALKLGQARGVALLVAVKNKKTISEYSPREVKKSVVGNGAASKEQVQYMVKSLLKMRSLPKHYDTTDALAVAICHSFHLGTSSGNNNKPAHYRDWKSFVETNPNVLKIV